MGSLSCLWNCTSRTRVSFSVLSPTESSACLSLNEVLLSGGYVFPSSTDAFFNTSSCACNNAWWENGKRNTLRCIERRRQIRPDHTSTRNLASIHAEVENCVKNCSINERLRTDSLIFQCICRPVFWFLSHFQRHGRTLIFIFLKNCRPSWMIGFESFRSTVFSFQE